MLIGPTLFYTLLTVETTGMCRNNLATSLMDADENKVIIEAKAFSSTSRGVQNTTTDLRFEWNTFQAWCELDKGD